MTRLCERAAKMRAVVYATVAWAFGDPAPNFSRGLESRMRAGLTGESEINRCKRAWRGRLFRGE